MKALEFVLDVLLTVLGGTWKLCWNLIAFVLNTIAYPYVKCWKSLRDK